MQSICWRAGPTHPGPEEMCIRDRYQIMTGDIVYKDLIQLDLDVRNTDELFEVMAGRLMELGYVTGDFLESIKEREKEYPTALPIEPYACLLYTSRCV